MTTKIWRRLAGACAVAAFAAVPMSGASAQAENKCELNAYTIDEDPNGINIRSAPSNQGKVVGVIKAKKDDDVQVDIVAESNGWFRIKAYEHFAVTRNVKIDGWLHGSRLGSGLMIMQAGKASERLLEEPSARSKTLLLLTWDPGEDQQKQDLWAELPGDKREKIDFAKIKHAATAVLLACTGGYVKVRVHKYEGWVPAGRLCGNPVTTCN